MDDTTAILLGALVGGLAAGALRLPPLLGFLAAGFVLFAFGVEAVPVLETVSDLGVTVLLFGVGLKIDLRSLLGREVWLTSTTHLLGITAPAAGLLGLMALVGIGLVAEGELGTWLLVGFALSFSSTVYVVKVLEERGATNSLIGRCAIGVLVIQDLAAVLFLAVLEGKVPSPWAVLLLGMLLAGQPRAAELAKSLFTVKDLLLVGFFISIGLGGIPTLQELLIAALFLLLLPIKALGFALLFWAAGLRRRTAVLTGTALANFSEFGLIVIVAAPDRLLDDDWTPVIATAVAASFVIASLQTRRQEDFIALLNRLLPDRPTERLHPEDRPLELADTQVLVLGTGRVGLAAYERLSEGYGLRALGMESDRERCERLVSDGVNVVEGDATDAELWKGLDFSGIEVVLLAMPLHHSNIEALELLHENGYVGKTAIVTQYDDDLREARDEGVDIGFQLYEGAGAELADRAAATIGREER